ncbi:GTPase domain-containing protein [Anabaena sp. FACHB-1237]|uniref:GTPase domain-containing protein n=1 Tax=Anabaena sp. FACHB-1237 TaxID=2692769 RepID=UPI0016814B13|nr:GTPase domain-containing protein [Anabaena sp. FACHB-1237]MBD2138182.1 GTPase domain-containing protein [Anabaena sp. FACHB-1237]
MGVVFIGDRATGKTHLAMELTNPKHEYVKVINQDYEMLKANLKFDEVSGVMQATDVILDRLLDIEVRLPTGNKQVLVDWIDTPGEVWRKSWQQDNQKEWSKLLQTIRDSEGIFLVLPPHRGLTFQAGVDVDEFMSTQQWCARFERWVDFFRTDCPKARHIVICLNKADLFCNLSQESSQLAYHPNGGAMNWQQRHLYSMQRYFRPIQSQLAEINKSVSGLSVRCFITSVYDRSLLELPWIYLGSFLAK